MKLPNYYFFSLLFVVDSWLIFRFLFLLISTYSFPKTTAKIDIVTEYKLSFSLVSQLEKIIK